MKINLQDKLVNERKTALAEEKQDALNNEIDKLLANVEKEHQDKILSDFGFDYKVEEVTRAREVEKRYPNLDKSRIFTYRAIEKVCKTYGLRFLPTRLYKGQLDAGLGPAKVEFEDKIGLKGSAEWVDYSGYIRRGCGVVSYAIAAPKASFVLQERPKDPLLFASLGDEHYYLVHKWGDDLSIWNHIVAKYAGFALAPLLVASSVFLYAHVISDNLAGILFVMSIAGAVCCSIKGVDELHTEQRNWNSHYL